MDGPVPGGFTAVEQEEIWVRWRRCESLRTIARHFGRDVAHVRRFLARTGGRRLPPRHRAGRQLTAAEREEVSRALAGGESCRAVDGAIRRLEGERLLRNRRDPPHPVDPLFAPIRALHEDLRCPSAHHRRSHRPRGTFHVAPSRGFPQHLADGPHERGLRNDHGGVSSCDVADSGSVSIAPGTTTRNSAAGAFGCTVVCSTVLGSAMSG
jgi:hypothetical protein